MKIKTAEATKLQLDWGVALARGYTQLTLQVAGKVYGTASDGGREQISHTDPAVCMGLIKEHKINIDQKECAPEVWAAISFTGQYSDGKPYDDFVCCIADTIEQAVARCVISMKLGETFEVPDELGVVG